MAVEQVTLTLDGAYFGAYSLDANEQASFVRTNIAVGTHSLYGVYTGSKYLSSQSATVTFTVNPLAGPGPSQTTVTVTPATSTVGDAITFTMTVTPGP